MRIPIPVVVITALLAVLAFWWLRTKDMDFMTPRGTAQPLPEFMTNPPDEDPDPGPILAAQVPAEEDPPTPATPSQPDLELGDLESSPGLAEYSEHAGKGAGYLMRIATELESQGHWQRSLLAWERVIDSCHPAPLERKTAEDAIVRIRPTLPHWNIDPEGDLPIYLHLGTTRKTTEALKEAAQEVADFLRRDSDHALLIEPRITTSRVANPKPDAPIAIYFSAKGKSDPNLRSLTPAEDDPEHYTQLLLLNAYQLVRQGVVNAGADGILPPETTNHPTDPSLDFQRQVTRLHWKIFAESLAREAEESAP